MYLPATAGPINMSHVITANRLSDGLVVYRREGAAWTTAIAQASVYASEAEAAPALEGAKQDVIARLIVDPYAVLLDPASATRRPKSLKEAIRAFGPTIRYGNEARLEAAE